MQGVETQILAFSEGFVKRVKAVFPDTHLHQRLHRALDKGRTAEVRRELQSAKSQPLSTELMRRGLQAEHGSPAHEEASAAVERKLELDALFILIAHSDYP